MIELEKGKTGLGLSLAGNRDRSRMSVFVVGIDPNGAAGRDGRMVVGDELLEVRCVLTVVLILYLKKVGRIFDSLQSYNLEKYYVIAFGVPVLFYIFTLGEKTCIIIYFCILSDQWASPLWPQSPECILHNQELSIQSQNHLCQVSKHLFLPIKHSLNTFSLQQELQFIVSQCL